MTTTYLATSAVAQRLGLAPETIRSYVKKGMLPEPDAILDDCGLMPRGWLPSTLDAWQASRPRPRITAPTSSK